MNKSLNVLLIAAIGGLVLSGCSAGSSDTGSLEPTAAVAQLDPSTESIIYPLDRYTLASDELRIVERAGNIRMQECLAESGHVVDLLASLPVEVPYVGDRVYGIWGMENAQLRGYGIPVDETEVFDLGEQSTAFNRDWDECGSSVISSANLGLGQDSIFNRLKMEASRAAQANPEWNHAIGEWQTCLTEQGLELSDENPWAPDLTDVQSSKEDEIRLAVTDVACKDETALIQRLADLEASYQQTLINQHEAELVAGREGIEARVEAAREIIASN